MDRHIATATEAQKKHDVLKKKYDKDLEAAQNNHENLAL